MQILFNSKWANFFSEWASISSGSSVVTPKQSSEALVLSTTVYNIRQTTQYLILVP